MKKSLQYLLKWSALSILIGVVVGMVGSAFARSIDFATKVWQTHTWMLFLFPICGICIVTLYWILGDRKMMGTNLVLESITSGEEIPIQMAPAIFISTVFTHLGAGSSGREGAALQIGGSIGNWIAKITRLGQSEVSHKSDKNIAIMCGMAACFSAIFGTPVTAACFSLEIISVGVFYHAALLPCLLSAFIAGAVSRKLGIIPESFWVSHIPDWTVANVLWFVLLGMLVALVAILFSQTMHRAEHLYTRYFKNPYARILVASIIFIGITLLEGTWAYNGGGFLLIERSMEGDVSYFAFLFKIVFTAIALGGGFKGGEIVPTLAIGATFGGAFAKLTGQPFDICSACGMLGCFVGVTNAPLATIFLGIELCGSIGMNFYVIVIAVSFVLSGYYGLYSSQKFAYSKTEAVFIGARAKDMIDIPKSKKKEGN